MFISKSEPLLVVPASEGTVFTVTGPAAQQKRVVVRNTDGASTLTYRYQTSNDATTWTDLASDATLGPGLENQQDLVGFLFYRFRASGNLNIAVKIDAEIAFNGTFSFNNF